MNEAERNVRAIRGRLLSFLRAPHGAGDAQSYRYTEDGNSSTGVVASPNRS